MTMVRKSKGLVRMEPRSHTSAQQHLRQHRSGSRQKIEWMICLVSAKARKEPVCLERSIPTVSIGSAIATGLHRSYVQPYQKEEISGSSRAPRLSSSCSTKRQSQTMRTENPSDRGDEGSCVRYSSFFLSLRVIQGQRDQAPAN